MAVPPSQCADLSGTTFVRPFGITVSNTEIFMNADALEANYDKVMQPIVSTEFTKAFPRSRAACHLASTASTTEQLQKDIATLIEVRKSLQEKLRVLPYYVRSQKVQLEALRGKSNFANAVEQAQLSATDPITRGTAGFLQWPLTESMTAPMAVIAMGFAVLSGVAGYWSYRNPIVSEGAFGVFAKPTAPWM